MFILQGHALSWTDDLPVCYLSGVGFATNQAYREDGFRREQHEFEDRSFHFRYEIEWKLFNFTEYDKKEGKAHLTGLAMVLKILDLEPLT